jgi:hypothetical protein
MATYYWVGGTGTWSGTGNTQFATTSGGVATLLNPTNADTVNFDANSGTAATVTVTSTAVALNTTVNKSDINLSLSGSATLTGTNGSFTLTAGTITLNSFTLSCFFFNTNNSNTRAIAFGTGAITVTGNGTTVWSAATLTGLTVTGTPTVNFTYSGATATRTINHGLTAGGSASTAISAIVSAGTDGLNPVGYFVNLNLTGYAGAITSNNRFYYGSLTLSSGCSYTIGANTENFVATSGIQKVTCAGKTINNVTINGVGTTVQLQDTMTLDSATAKQITLTNGTLDLFNQTLVTSAFASSNSNTRSILFGTGNVTCTGNATTIWTTATTTGLTITGTPVINANYAGATGTRTITTGTLTEATSPTVNITAGTDTVNVITTVKNLNFTGFSGTLSNNPRTIYGNVTISSGMTLTAGANAWTFAATSGTQQITTAAKTFDFPLTFNGIGGTFAFQDALTQGSTRAFTITNGTVQLKASVTSTVGSFVANSGTMKYLQSTLAGTQATISQASGTVGAFNLTIKDINATGGATWNAYYINGDINDGNNTGWDFLVQLGRYIYTRRKNKVILN